MADKDIRYSVTAEDRFSRTFAALKRDIAGSRDLVTGLGEKAALASRGLALLSFGTAAGALGFGAAVRQLANDIDSLNDSADATGSTIENLSALEDIARRNGGSLELATSAVVKLNAALKEAKADSPIVKALEAVGLNAQELRRLDPSEALRRVAIALAGYADDGNKARLVQELFGKSLKEVAPFLKDLAAAGELNAKVTAEQAAQAERFNKQLAELSTNASNAARRLTGELLPGLSRVLGAFNKGGARGAVDEIGEIIGLGKEYYARRTLKIVADDVELLRLRVATQQKGSGLTALKAELEERTAEMKAAEKALAAIVDAKPNAGAGRGFVNPPNVDARPSVGASLEIQKAQVTEAQRMLETLERQVASEQQLTQYERLMLELETKRIEGMNPALESRLKKTARYLDLMKLINEEHEREAGLLKLISDKDQRDVNEGLDLMSRTPTGQRENIARQSDLLLRLSRANPDDPVTQTKVSEAMQALRKQMDEINGITEPAKTEFDKLADHIEKSMDRATSSVIDFVLEGKGSVSDLGKSFARDVLRGLIEDPIRETMKSAVAAIRKELGKVGEGGNPFGALLEWLQSSSNGGSGGSGGNWWSAIMAFFGGSGGATGRANGGGVRAGQLVRWQENGREWFVPGSDGTVVNPGQQKALAARSAVAPVINQTFHVNGDVSPQTVAAMDAMIQRNNARLMRSMRTGGTWAAG